MSVAIDQIQVGSVFRFEAADRRVTSLRDDPQGKGVVVEWVYADGKERGGREGGWQWRHYFAAKAIEAVRPAVVETRRLVSGREVEAEAAVGQVVINTRCPRKWAFTDLETGEVWVHSGERFERAPAEVIAEMEAVIGRAKGESG